MDLPRCARLAAGEARLLGVPITGNLRSIPEFPNSHPNASTVAHLAEGCSLRETAVRDREGGIAHVSDVAIMISCGKQKSGFAG